MPRLTFLTATEKRNFDLPPSFQKDERPAYFMATGKARKIISSLKSEVNKVSFLLQLGYFKYSGKFFTPEQFRVKDIKYVKQQLSITSPIDFDTYRSSTRDHHTQRIMALYDWEPLNDDNQERIREQAQLLVQQQISPKQLFFTLVDFCWKQKIEIPSYFLLSEVITDCFNSFEEKQLSLLDKTLSPVDCLKLDELLSILPTSSRAPLSELKTINQSLRAKQINDNVEACITYAEYFTHFQSIFGNLQLTDHATVYYANWVEKAKLSQLLDFPDRNKAYLYLLAFIRHQYFMRQDALVDIFLKCVRSAFNSANKKVNEQDKSSRSERKKAIKVISKAHKKSRLLLEQIIGLVKHSSSLTPHEKIEKIEMLIGDYESQQSDVEKEQLIKIEENLIGVANNLPFYDILEIKSIALQRKISGVIKNLIFCPASSDSTLCEALNHFKETDGQLGAHPIMDFLSEKEQEIVVGNTKFRISLYKILLFHTIAEGIRSGKMNLKYTYRYRAIQDYLIPMSQWEEERDSLLKAAGLLKFADGKAYLAGLKTTLEKKYQTVNDNCLSGSNTFLKVDEAGKIKLDTPSTDYSEREYVSGLLNENGLVPILKILREINAISDYAESFKHSSHKHSKLKPSADTIIAGIIGNGCNIGIEKLSDISIGINSNHLSSTVQWCFSLENLQSANDKVLSMIDKLALSNSFKRNPGEIHTSSDGRKVNVAVDSLLANYSFKYFGKNKGVSLYTFVDERHVLFHSTVISASDREAAYVIDGLLQNEVVRSDMHSTDTHGFTEAIFTATHMIDTAFAPRIKKIAKQTLYGFSTRSTYRNKGYVITPSRTIKQKLILDNWDDILRFMATIKLKHSTASQLFKRLSSYAKDHPLYQALKEFGRILKSQYILTYFDDLDLRQRIEKQLNKVEATNKFSKAVFFARNQEFHVGLEDEQKIITACKVLIQNSIILWNYLYLSQLLTESSKKAQLEMVSSITSGSIVAWRHVNLQGEYDFTRHAANDSQFDMRKILALRIA